ncbi:Ada metal-binding domain-containing protein [Streptomyces sp. NBC_01361]|uniref:Ada metal-binding domain-containing protein n=1 Tax=Streptomyces sp. NBC_01361 TaxID=2903838 RepID=UPI002E333886|nr:Ada metal-binding domain-containing protein [Streptomyces sp. NBC_01361]
MNRDGPPAPYERERTYTLLGRSGTPYLSTTPGTLGGHRRGRLYGRLDCPSALRAISRGHYVKHRVFFPDEATAVAAGFRPCAVCLPEEYAHWRADRESTHHAMNNLSDGESSRSPLISPADLAAHGDLPRPSPHTEAELAALIRLLTLPKSRIETITVGHSRDEASRQAAGAFATAWAARGGKVLTTVNWPENAASWLRPATRLTAGLPDAWVVAAAPLGFAQLARRLHHSTDWDPSHTYAFASLNDSRVPALTGPDTLHGLRGATADGGTWEIRRGWVTTYDPADSTP